VIEAISYNKKIRAFGFISVDINYTVTRHDQQAIADFLKTNTNLHYLCISKIIFDEEHYKLYLDNAVHHKHLKA
jgi:hypothetical protein